MTDVDCPICGRTLTVVDGFLRRHTWCPDCSRVIIVPRSGEPEEFVVPGEPIYLRKPQWKAEKTLSQEPPSLPETPVAESPTAVESAEATPPEETVLPLMEEAAAGEQAIAIDESAVEPEGRGEPGDELLDAEARSEAGDQPHSETESSEVPSPAPVRSLWLDEPAPEPEQDSEPAVDESPAEVHEDPAISPPQDTPEEALLNDSLAEESTEIAEDDWSEVDEAAEDINNALAETEERLAAAEAAMHTWLVREPSNAEPSISDDSERPQSEAKSTYVGRLMSDLKAERAERSDLEKQFEEAHGELERLRQELTRFTESRPAQEAEHNDLAARCQNAEHRAEEAEQQASALQTELEQIHHQRQELEQSLENVSRQRDELQSHLENVQQERDALKEDLSATAGRQGEMQASLEEALARAEAAEQLGVEKDKQLEETCQKTEEALELVKLAKERAEAAEQNLAALEAEWKTQKEREEDEQKRMPELVDDQGGGEHEDIIESFLRFLDPEQR